MTFITSPIKIRISIRIMQGLTRETREWWPLLTEELKNTKERGPPWIVRLDCRTGTRELLFWIGKKNFLTVYYFTLIHCLGPHCPASCAGSRAWSPVYVSLAQTLIACGIHFIFSSQGKTELPRHKLEVWPGYVTSIRQHENNLLLCVDISHKVRVAKPNYRSFFCVLHSLKTFVMSCFVNFFDTAEYQMAVPNL